MGCWWVGGSLGKLTGVQLEDRIILSASRKLRNSEATNRSCGQSNVGLDFSPFSVFLASFHGSLALWGLQQQANISFLLHGSWSCFHLVRACPL